MTDHLGALESEPIVVAARPVLEEEARALGETFFLVAARAGRLVVLDKAEGTGFLRAAPRVGSSVPVHATAVGKLFLAFGGDAITAPAEPFERFSENTCTRAHELASDVERARRRGFAENREEWIPGLSVLAAPVRAGDRMLGAVAMAASSHHFLALGAEEIAQRALAAAERIAARLEGTGR